MPLHHNDLYAEYRVRRCRQCHKSDYVVPDVFNPRGGLVYVSNCTCEAAK